MRLYPRYQQCLIDCDMAVYQIEDGPRSSAPTAWPHQSRNGAINALHVTMMAALLPTAWCCNCLLRTASLQLVHPCKSITRQFADLMMHTVPSLSLSGFRERAIKITKQDDADPWGKQSCVHPHPRSYRYTANLIASGLAHGSRQRGKGMKSLST